MLEAGLLPTNCTGWRGTLGKTDNCGVAAADFISEMRQLLLGTAGRAQSRGELADRTINLLSGITAVIHLLTVQSAVHTAPVAGCLQRDQVVETVSMGSGIPTRETNKPSKCWQIRLNSINIQSLVFPHLQTICMYIPNV